MEKLYKLSNSRQIRLIEGDITRIPADAIANAANSLLIGGGGVDEAIHRAGGPEIMRELDQLRPTTIPLPAGEAVATTAGLLPAKFVFHTVGPFYRDGRAGEPEDLASCYRHCLRMAEDRQCRTISFPAISTGIFRYPAEPAARIAIKEVISFLTDTAAHVQEVIFVQFGAAAYELYERALAPYWLHA